MRRVLAACEAPPLNDPDDSQAMKT